MEKSYPFPILFEDDDLIAINKQKVCCTGFLDVAIWAKQNLIRLELCAGLHNGL